MLQIVRPGHDQEEQYKVYYLPEIASIFRHKPADVDSLLNVGGQMLVYRLQTISLR
jgi:hypothetical protein